MLPYFGVQVERKTVPVEDVKVMETDNKYKQYALMNIEYFI